MIKIAHLYYDLMNLYGEHANIRALKQHFENQGAEVEVAYLTKGDEINFNQYDIFYMGMGTEMNQLIVIEDIMKYQNKIKNVIDKKMFIITGNSLEIFGNYILNKKSKINTLGIFDYYSERVEERIAIDGIYISKLIEQPFIGSHNRGSIMYSEKNEFLRVLEGQGSNPNTHLEGYQLQDFYGTYLIGPLLIRNPYFTDYLVKRILEQKKLSYKDNKDSLSYKAYDEYLKNFLKKDKS